MCPNWESNWSPSRLRDDAQPTLPHCLGLIIALNKHVITFIYEYYGFLYNNPTQLLSRIILALMIVVSWSSWIASYITTLIARNNLPLLSIFHFYFPTCISASDYVGWHLWTQLNNDSDHPCLVADFATRVFSLSKTLIFGTEINFSPGPRQTHALLSLRATSDPSPRAHCHPPVFRGKEIHSNNARTGADIYRTLLIH